MIKEAIDELLNESQNFKKQINEFEQRLKTIREELEAIPIQNSQGDIIPMRDNL